VQISLKLDDNQAQLQMVSAHSHVRAALEAALPVCGPHWRRTAFSFRRAASAAKALPGSSSPHHSSNSRLRVPAHGGFNEESDELLPTLPPCNPPRVETVP
jgi:flagellar hook-length control protein FliK